MSVRITQEQQHDLDRAVKTAIRSNRGARASEIQKDSRVVTALSKLPSGKPDFRYLDNSLQRLRKAGDIKTVGGGWGIR